MNDICHTFSVRPGRRIRIMGIINLTDNSYYPPSRCLDADSEDWSAKAVERAAEMIQNGAEILDFGACSTRPGSSPVGEEEEWRRLAPALEAVKERFPLISISVDTYWPSVVERVHGLIGDFIINDITAGRGLYGSDDRQGRADMLSLAGRLSLPYVAMHMRGTPETMQGLCEYEDVTLEVLDYFKSFAKDAEYFGVQNWILDPGFGFAKTIEQNYKLMRELSKFMEMRRPILVGISRKSMIYKRFGLTPETSLPETQVLHYKALCNGADILRVHDVAEAARTVALYKELENNN